MMYQLSLWCKILCDILIDSSDFNFSSVVILLMLVGVLVGPSNNKLFMFCDLSHLFLCFVKIEKERCLLSTVLVVSPTDAEMLFSVAGFQTSTVKKNKKIKKKTKLRI